MTSDQRNQFEAEWPALALRLQKMLRRKRLNDWIVDDLVQETGCRLIRMWTEIDRTKPVWPLVTTIALNLLRDEMRKGSWSELIGAVPDSPSIENVETRAQARLELQRVGGALSRLNQSQRSVLLAEVNEVPSRGADPTAMRMLRMRARKRLHQLMDQASVLGVTAGMQLRRVIREAELFVSKALPLDAERVPAAALSIVAALSLGLVALPADERANAGVENGSERTIVAAGDLGADASYQEAFDRARTRARAAKANGRASATGRDSRSDRKKRNNGTDGGPGGGGGSTQATSYYIPISEGTYVSGRTSVELEGFDEEGRDAPQGVGTGSLSCSTSASGGTGASCTHGGDGWSQRSARVKQQQEVWVRGERVL